MKVIKLIIASSFFIINCAYSQKLNLKPGLRFAFETNDLQKGLNIASNSFTYEFEVLNKDSLGNHTLRCKVQAFKIVEPHHGNVISVFNSDSVKNIKFNSTTPLIPLAILQKPFKILINPNGNIEKVIGFEKLINDAANMWTLNDDRKQNMIQNSKDFHIYKLQPLFFRVPKTTVKYGAEWLSEDSLITFNVTAIKGAKLVIKYRDALIKTKTGNNISGLYELNDVTGLLESVNLTSKNIQPDPNNKPYTINYSYNQKLHYSNFEYPEIDTAWVTMAIKSTTWMSDALKTNSEFDSVKTLKFFKENDEKYSNDRHYIVTKLHLIQQLKGEDKHEWYNSLVIKTPNHYLVEESSHQHNKLQSTLKLNPDSSYVLVKMMLKENHLNDWIQHSFAQHFIDFTDKESRIKSYQLLEKLHADKDPELQKIIHPLYLWVLSKEPNKENKSLIRTGSGFLTMKEDMMKNGNGGRYAMLVYSLLKKADEKKLAGTLLNQTITRLEKYTSDTLNINRYADQNLLAHAYFLKYVDTEKTDSLKALSYLAKAGEYSPKSQKEKAYSSFYDRVFLESRESYRDNYLDVLTKNGDKKNALNVLVQHVNSNPGDLQGMQKFYETRFKDKTFKAFFSEDILSAWQKAPAFTLKGIDDKDISLTDYSGKWLVLDFWGTWCGPCKAEMPQINAFYNEVKEGKYPGVDFLSVACRDTKANVISYFINHNYTLPGVISDNSIEKNYNVPHYPTKVIISPEGKMLMVDSENWRELVKQFSGLYTSVK